MMHSHKTEVLVVGAGPVGLMTGLALAEREIHVQVVDKARRTNLHSYCLALHPQSLRLLNDLNLADSLIAQGTTVDTIVIHRGAERFATVNLSSLEGRFPFVLVLPQCVLENALESRLKEAGLRVSWDHEVGEIREYENGVGVGIDVLGDVPQGYPIMQMHRMVTGNVRMAADYLVGADGYHSSVRRASEIAYEHYNNEEIYAVYEFSTEDKLEPILHLVYDDEGAAIFWPIQEGRGRWSFQIPRGMNFQSSMDQLNLFLKNRAPWFEARPTDIDWFSCVRFDHRRAERFGRERVWLAGDAAHLTSPVGTQSMNMGLREANDLAWRLFEILRNNGSPNLLEIYNTNSLKNWEAMLHRPDHVRAAPGADPWVEMNRARLADSMPATGKDLETLIQQIGLETV